MPRFSRDPLNRMISLRVTGDQERLLEAMAKVLGLPGGKADILRTALDYWLEHAPEAQRAAKEAGPQAKEAGPQEGG